MRAGRVAGPFGSVRGLPSGTGSRPTEPLFSYRAVDASVFPLQFGFPGGPELLVLGLLFLIIPFVLAYWVYTDAEERGEENAALWAVGVGALTYLTLFGGILALVVYIWQRDDAAT